MKSKEGQKLQKGKREKKKNNALKINFFLVGEAFFKQSGITAKGLLFNYTSQPTLSVPEYPLAPFEALELSLFFCSLQHCGKRVRCLLLLPIGTDLAGQMKQDGAHHRAWEDPVSSLELAQPASAGTEWDHFCQGS
ncbi:hypothetical protein VI817_002678 [Penicillium citrinum]|nr:hypothetical protein VI817_002678 [Penicillium citrinum]